MLKRLTILFFLFPAAAFAQGHGPVFGYATPTNSQGEYSFDAGLLARTSADGAPAFRAGNCHLWIHLVLANRRHHSRVS